MARVRLGSAALLLAAAALVGAGCGGRRTPEERAAVRAQDACIAALEPVSKSERPSDDALATASRDADAAARADRRWAPLRTRVLDFKARRDALEALDALAQECGRVNQIVKEKRGDVEPGASG